MVSEDAYTLLIEANNHLLTGHAFSLAWAVEHGDRLHDAWENCESPRLLMELAARVAPLSVSGGAALDIAAMVLSQIRKPVRIQATEALEAVRRFLHNEASDEGRPVRDEDSDEELMSALNIVGRFEREHGAGAVHPASAAVRALVAAVSLVALDGHGRRAESHFGRLTKRSEYMFTLEFETAMALGDTDETMAEMVRIVRAHIPTLTMADLVEATAPR